METKTVYVAYTNTDLTEGRGKDIPIAVCEEEVPAIRLAQNQYVQGSDGPVRTIELMRIENDWYLLASAVEIVPPTKQDREKQQKLNLAKEAMEKAKSLGLTEDEIKAIRGGSK